jgi:hypothetical protein
MLLFLLEEEQQKARVYVQYYKNKIIGEVTVLHNDVPDGVK